MSRAGRKKQKANCAWIERLGSAPPGIEALKVSTIYRETVHSESFLFCLIVHLWEENDKDATSRKGLRLPLSYEN